MHIQIHTAIQVSLMRKYSIKSCFGPDFIAQRRGDPAAWWLWIRRPMRKQCRSEDPRRHQTHTRSRFMDVLGPAHLL